MTLASLRSLALAQPAGSPCQLAYAAGNDSACADALNARTLPGPVPIVVLAGFCAQQGVTGGVMTMLEVPLGAAIPGGSGPTAAMTPAIKGALHTAMTILQNDYRLETCDVLDPAFQQACGLLQMLGIMTAGQYATIQSLAANRASLADALGAVTAADVECARKGNS